MKKSYSSLNILQKRLSGAMDSSGLFGTLLSGRKYITITMPYYDYIRGKVFIQDLRDNYEEQVPYHFDIAVLLYMLYDDFLTQVKKGAKNEQIANYLFAGKKRYFQKKTKARRIMKPLTQHVFQFETVEEEEEEVKVQEEKTAYIELRMRESEVLRGEVLVHDLLPYTKDIEISVEEMITIVYLDFIQNVKSDGNSLKVQKSILEHIKRM